MEDERAYELLMSQMGILREEKAKLSKQVESLLAELGHIREDRSVHEQQMQTSINELTEQLKKYNDNMEVMRKTISHLQDAILNKDEYIKALLQKQENLENMLKGGRRHRFGRSSEQRDLLNNRERDGRAAEKDDFDGSGNTPAAPSDTPRQARDTSGAKSSRPGRKRSPKQPHQCDRTVYHKVEDYYRLPDGARFMMRDGERDISYYRVVRVKKAEYIEEIYEVARVRLADGTFANTMDKPYNELMGIFSPEMLAQVLCWKYVYHLSANRIRKMLGNEGLRMSTSSLNSYMQNGMSLLKEKLEEPMRREMLSTVYLMVDETAEVVGVEGEDGSKSFKKRYMWAFFAKLKNMVYYLYEKGSRARSVVVEFLKGFSGFISTDGYVAYSIFDDAEKHPGIVHIGCWTHARRKLVDSLPSEPRAMELINEIAELFKLETTFKLLNLSHPEIKKRRQKRSAAILRRIHDKAVLMSIDVKLMANDLMKTAINYLLNQWKSLENFIKDGRVQISNNLCEQRMKPVKLNLKNCQNIGSERAAGNTAFIFSLTESCALLDINPEEYLTKVFTRLTSKEECDRRQLLPCYIKI